MRTVDRSAVLLALNRQGQLLPGWPLRWSSTHTHYGAGTAAHVDVDGDDARELIVDGDTDFELSFSLRGFELQGGMVPGFPRPTGRNGIGPFTSNTPAVLPTGSGNLGFTVGGCAVAPGTSTINFAPGQNRANLAILPLASNGTGAVSVFPSVAGSGTVHLILDVTGYFQ